MEIGKLEGILKRIVIFLPQIRKTTNNKKQILMLAKNARVKTLIDSLSLLGRTMASSNLSDDITAIIPIILRYTE